MKKRNWRRILPALLCVLMLALAACNNGDTKKTPVNENEPGKTDPADNEGKEPEKKPEDPVTQEPVKDENAVRIRFFTIEGVDNWGDCTYIEFPNGENMLIDAGLTNAGRQIVEDLLDQGIDTIDHLVLTHSHADHVQGLSNVLGNMTVKHAYTSGYFTPDFKWVLRDISGRGVEHIALHAGDTFSVGDVRFDVLWPRAEDVAVSPNNNSTVAYGPGSTEDLNNHSVVFKMTYGENTALFTGDLYVSGEADILKNYSDNLDVLKCDLLKIMHHGAETSSSEAFVQAISPKYAVAMGTRTMTNILYNRYASVGCTTYLSWMNGNVYVTMDGKNITVTPDNPEISDYYTKGSGSPKGSE